MKKFFTAIFILIGFGISKIHAQSLSVNFNANNQKGCSPFVVSFSNNSTGKIAKYYWDFGNGSTSNLKNPSTIFKDAGFYHIKLIIMDSSGKIDSLIKQNFIQVYKNPIANLYADKTIKCVNEVVQFYDSSIKGDAQIIKWDWDLNKGNSDTLQNPSYTFDTGNDYTIALKVTDKNGCNNIIYRSQYIRILDAPTPDFSLVKDTICTLPKTIKFLDKSANPSGQPLTYSWQFGNLGTSSEKNPTYIFTQRGSFDISLEVSINQICATKKTFQNFVDINVPLADFNISDTNGCIPISIMFTDNSKDTNDANYYWDFGDSTSDKNKNTNHTYFTSGKKNISLTVTNKNGCNNTITKQIKLKEALAPTFDFESKDSITCDSNAISKLTFHSNDEIISQYWNIDDSLFSEIINPSFQLGKGVFDVSLTIINKAGCKAYIKKKNYLQINPLHAIFDMDNDSGCIDLKVNFQNKSRSFRAIKSYQWFFDNGDTSSSKNPQTVYKNYGKFLPKLIIKDDFGCLDSLVYNQVLISKKPHADFTFTRGTGCSEQDRIYFKNLSNNDSVKASKFKWYANNDEIYGGFEFSRLFNDSGVYTIKLIANNNNCMDEITKKDTLHILRTKTSFSIKENPCIDDDVTFKANIVNNNTEIKWYIDNNLVSDKPDFTKHLYYGTYTIKMIAYDKNSNCSDTSIQSLTLRKDPLADFEVIFNTKILCTHSPVKLVNTSPNKGNSKWYITDNGEHFVDDATSNYTFKSGGEKTIKLLNIDNYGCVGAATKSFHITQPTNSISFGKNVICFPGNVELINKSTSTSPIIRKYWEIENNIFENPKDTFTYHFQNFPKDGNKGVKVKFYSSDYNGCISIDSSYVKISNPKANFRVSNIMDCDSSYALIIFDDYKSFPTIKNNLVWMIDNKKISENSSSFNYSTKKDLQFDIKLIVKDGNLTCTDTSENRKINLLVKKIEASFSASDSISDCPPFSVNFRSTSTAENSNVYRYLWDFNDKQNSIFANPYKTYFYPGEYPVKLIVFDNQGCSDTIVKSSFIKINGPKASFKSDLKNGCIPSVVHFKMNRENVADFIWELGNGIVSDEENPTTIYDFKGVFNPYLIAKDSAGCVVFYYDDSVITIHENPIANFKVEGFCRNALFNFSNYTFLPNTEKANYIWNFGDGDSSSQKNTSHVYKTSGYKEIHLKAISEFGCKHDTTNIVYVSPIEAKFSIQNDSVCFGNKTHFMDQSSSFGKILYWNYNFGNNEFSAEQNPNYEYTKENDYSVKLRITDEFGCFDTISSKTPIVVFDSASPKPILMLRTTVNNNSETHFNWTIDNSKSTLYYKLFHWNNDIFDPNPLILDKNISEFYGVNQNTQKNKYAYYITSKSFCHETEKLDTIKKHQTMVLNTINGQSKINLHWNAYKGWENIKSYHILRKDTNETLFKEIANIKGTSTSYIDNSVTCDNHYDYKIQAEENDGNSQFSLSNNKDGYSLIQSVPFAPELIRATVNNNTETQVEWNISQPNINPIKTYTLQKSLDQISFKNIYETMDDNCCNFYFDRNVNTDKQSYTYRIIANDICGIKSQASNIGKTILLDVVKDYEQNPALNWTQYLEWENGVKQYEIELKDEHNFYNKIDQKLGNESLIFTDKSSNYEDFDQICYRIKAISFDKNNGNPVYSYSNEKCVVGKSNIFVPNAFTPNSDSHNPEFLVFGKFIKEYQIKIYNRWGQLIFESNDLQNSWDGTYQENAVEEGVYLYTINALGYDEHTIKLNGSITLLR